MTNKPSIEVIWKGRTKPEDRTDVQYSFMSKAVNLAIESQNIDPKTVKKIIYVEDKLINIII